MEEKKVEKLIAYDETDGTRGIWSWKSKKEDNPVLLTKKGKKKQAKQIARQMAAQLKLKIGRWEGTYAKIKSGPNEGQWFHLNTHSVVSERPNVVPDWQKALL